MMILVQMISKETGLRTKPVKIDRTELADMLLGVTCEKPEAGDDYVLVIGTLDQSDAIEWAACPVYSVNTFVEYFSTTEAK